MTGRVARLLGVALLVVTFIAGALSGAALDRLVTAPERGVARERVNGSRGQDDDRRPSNRGATADLFDRIGVTPEQRAAIDEILARRAEQTRALWAVFGPQLEAIVDSTRAEIRALLTEEQLNSGAWMRIERRLIPGGPGGSPNGRNERH